MVSFRLPPNVNQVCHTIKLSISSKNLLKNFFYYYYLKGRVKERELPSSGSLPKQWGQGGGVGQAGRDLSTWSSLCCSAGAVAGCWLGSRAAGTGTRALLWDTGCGCPTRWPSPLHTLQRGVSQEELLFSPSSNKCHSFSSSQAMETIRKGILCFQHGLGEK